MNTRISHRIFTPLKNVTGMGLKRASNGPRTRFEYLRRNGDTNIITVGDINFNKNEQESLS